MVRDNVQLETTVNTISYEYLLDFTSEYGIPETLHSELPGPGDGIGWMSFSKRLVTKCFQRWDADEWYLLRRRCEGARHVSYPHPKTTGDVTMHGQNKSHILSGGREIDLFSLIRAPNPTKVKTGSRPRTAHEVPLLTLTATRVIETDEPAVATDSSGVPSTIERSPLNFAHEAEASGKGTAAPEMPSPEDVPPTTAPEADQAGELMLMLPQSVPANVSDLDPLAFADASSPHPGDVAQSSQGVAVAEDSESKNVSSSAEVGSPGSVYRPEWGVTNGSLLDTLRPAGTWWIMLLPWVRAGGQATAKTVAQVARRDQRIQARESEIKNLEALLETEVDALQQQVSREETLKAAFEEYKQQQDQLVEQRCAEMDARLDALSIDFDEELYPHMLIAIAGHRVAKGMSEGLKHMVEHGHDQLTVESLEADDLEAEAKFTAALQSLKDLMYRLLDQLEGLTDAPMDVIMAALYLEAKLGGCSTITQPPSKLLSARHPRVPRDGVLVSVPTVVPWGLALLLVDAATQTDLEDA
nr:hypothetical protein [Tanacetum cinerariifolium]